MKSLAKKPKLAVVVPDYPSPDNVYLCAFVHSRVKVYMQAGIDVEVFWCWGDAPQDYKYEFEGARVTKIGFGQLEEKLLEGGFSVCFLFFFDLNYEKAVRSANLSHIKFFLWSFNPETCYWDWNKFCTPYFEEQAPLSLEKINEFEKRDEVLKSLNSYENVSWVFATDFLRKRSEELIGFKYVRYHVIPSLVDDKVYKFKRRKPWQRRRVIFVKKFINVNTYACDIAMNVILELSKRKIFKKLTFDIYGEGEMFKPLTEPVKDFPNVHLHEAFLTQNEMKKLFWKSGIGFHPTRLDSQGVTMGEEAMSGLPVVSSNIDEAKYFLPNDTGLLCDVEDVCAYANAITALASDSNYYKKCAQTSHEKLKSMCSREKTVDKEIALFFNSI